MLKVADKDNYYAYIYASNSEELEIAKELFKDQVINVGPIHCNGDPAILVRKSSSKKK